MWQLATPARRRTPSSRTWRTAALTWRRPTGRAGRPSSSPWRATERTPSMPCCMPVRLCSGLCAKGNAKVGHFWAEGSCIKMPCIVYGNSCTQSPVCLAERLRPLLLVAEPWLLPHMQAPGRMPRTARAGARCTWRWAARARWRRSSWACPRACWRRLTPGGARPCTTPLPRVRRSPGRQLASCQAVRMMHVLGYLSLYRS